ncbi:aminoacyl-tRNA hydrolase [Alphaproteobacteria bacterium]|nr:aminoacyl-tRNA hydrolase [Alphaproteobacteria bacterium]
MRLLAGLGNPGSNYAMNRHNVGFLAVDRLADRHGCSPWKKKGPSLISDGRIGSEKILLVKPQSFMNKSGLPIAEIARFHKIDANDIFVFHDELDLATGKLRVKTGGGHGGHNGLRDIDRHIGVDYWRVRIGIGRPPNEAMDVKSWVLADFGRDEQTGWLQTLLDAMADEADRLVEHDDGRFMSRVSYLAPAPQPKDNNGKDKPAGAGSKQN